jgi:hypothetical protein
MRAVLFLHNAQQAWTAIRALWVDLKPWLIAGHRFELDIRPERRSTEANAKFHAICSDLAKSRHPWMGKPRSLEQWKVLLVSGHSVATKQGAEVICGLEGEFVNIRESTALMSRARSASLIEYAMAFCADNGIELSHLEAADQNVAEA